MSDYTQTPNYGLYKPLPSADIDQWGSHLNLNADTLDAALHGFLPLSGGSLSGSLIYTATGGTVSRTAQDRAADVANVLDYGADPTGAADSSAAFNAAAARLSSDGLRRKAVYAPAGTYLIRNQITLVNGQGLFGDAAGGTALQIDQTFSSSATSVIMCGTSVIEPGPMIRDLTIQFAQPSDVSSRSTFKTLAAGGTSGTGGTGVQYPFAISTTTNSGRIGVQNVAIHGGWNGIDANRACFWIDGLKLCGLNIGISMGGTVAAPVADWAHLNDIEFHAFGFNTTSSQNVYMDGNTIAMQIGAQNGLTAQNISCFFSRLVFTSDASGGWFSFTNLDMDADGATIEAAAVTVGWLKITNLYSTAGTNAPRPAAAFGGGPVMITNWYSHWGSPNQTLQVNGGDVTVTGAYLDRADTTVYAVLLQGGTLRMNACKINAQINVAYTQAMIAQAGPGNLQLDNIDIGGVAGSSGTGVLITSDNAANSVGRVILGTGWINNIQPTYTIGSYGLVASSGGAMNGALTITTQPSAANAQLELLSTAIANSIQSKLRFHGSFPTGGDYYPYMTAGLRSGWSATGYSASYLQLWLTNAAPGTGNDAAQIEVAGFTPNRSGMTLPLLPGSTTYANDAAAAAGGVIVGEIYRNGSAVMVRVT